MIFFKKQNFNTGALHDEYDSRDFKREELAKTTVPVWREKKEYKSYPVRNQLSSYSCVAQSVATILGALIQKENGKYLEVSAKPIYTQRSNDGGGMSFREAMDIGAVLGSSFEFSVPSQNIDEESINNPSNISQIDKYLGLYIINGYKYFSVPFNFDSIAAILEEENSLIVGFRWDYDEWDREFPKINTNSNRQYHHCVTIVDYTLINGKKYLVIQDSWGDKKGKNGLRFISEEWINRMTACWYYDKLEYYCPQELVKTKYKFTKDLEIGMKNEDVEQLQIVLKENGYFPDIEPTGYYGGITYDAVKKFQLDNEIIKTSSDAGVGRCGPKTRQVLNTKYYN
ncbi:MAG: peptidoglycan-binding protein [Candidatus Pacebacteria bacterium]|nr:peptidoglycan-binding protein [Candidatus Paceibacterota bacterium]